MLTFILYLLKKHHGNLVLGEKNDLINFRTEFPPIDLHVEKAFQLLKSMKQLCIENLFFPPSVESACSW